MVDRHIWVRRQESVSMLVGRTEEEGYESRTRGKKWNKKKVLLAYSKTAAT